LIGLLSILLAGVVLGIQTAEQGMNKVEGMPEQKPQSFYIKQIDKGEMEIAVMGKQVQANPTEMANYVSSVGLSIGGAVKRGTRDLLNWLSAFFQP
jgi:hypothetical protein